MYPQSGTALIDWGNEIRKYISVPEDIPDRELEIQIYSRVQEVVRERARTEGRPPYPPVEGGHPVERIKIIVEFGVPPERG